MALEKRNVNIGFGQGLDTKTDPFQIPIGKFLRLKNMVFNKGKLLEKRNGFKQLTSLPDSNSTFLTTFNNNLTALGTNFEAYSNGSATWNSKGTIDPVDVRTLPLIRTNLNQSQCDSVVASNGLVCTVYTDNVPSGGSTVASYKYVIADSETGQNIIAPTVIPVASGTVTGSPRVFVLGNYFVIVFDNVITAVNHLQYIAVKISDPSSVIANTEISATYTPASTGAFDGVVANGNLYLAWNGSDGGGAIRMTYIDSTLVQHGTVTFATRVATIMSVCADLTTSTPVIYASFYNSGTSTGYTLAVNQALTTVLAPTQIIAAGTILNITSAAKDRVCTVFYETSNAYSYDAAIKTNFVSYRTVAQGGSLGTATVLRRSVGLASKAFIVSSTIYVMTIYSSSFQPTYFLLNASGTIIAKLAYSNAGSYLVLGLPSVTISDNVAQVAYLQKDLVEAVNKTQGAAQAAGIYSQTGIQLGTFTFGTETISSAEIGKNLNLSGGFLTAYDGYVPVENGFHLWPDSVEVTATATTTGFLAAQIYYYVATYEWSDNQGNVFRSAPSIPVIKDLSGSGTATNKNTIAVPTLRLTAKTANPVKIVLYRWSTAQQTYYQVTSLSVPTLNDLTVDSVSIVDTLADASIIGNNILYTTGGVIENIGPPAFSVVGLFKSRLFGVDAEDRNLLWFSKQVIEGTPVEMSDLLTVYIAPTLSAQGNTGEITAISAMDDKLIIFKKDAIYYFTGFGPDNTGANNDFTDPIFITGTVGCANQNSIVFMPNGLMFQSDKGIWLLGRDLSTKYIGDAVDDFNAFTVLAAINVPATNEIRFTLDNGITLLYDYYFQQWGTLEGIPAISSTIYQGVPAFINNRGEVFQENPGSYVDGSNPVLMGFTTGWMNLAGLQGYERAYFFYLLASYLSPHKLYIQIAYDYQAPSQSVLISPTNFAGSYGSDPLYGASGVYGGSGPIEQWRVFFQRQKCQAFQITVDEIFDNSFGVQAGAGFSMSGLDLVVGAKGTYPRLPAANSVG